MAEFICYTPGIELSGRNILSVVEAMGPFKARGYEILRQHGIDNPVLEGWYSQQDWLDAFKTIYENIGPVTLELIGKTMSNSVNLPPHINKIEDAMHIVEDVYHMTHRKNGKPMLDPITGVKTEGIGHYYCEKMEDNHIRMVCNNPYPCVFDFGAGEALAQRYKPKNAVVKIVHNDSKECRRRGADSCTHDITWEEISE